MARDTLRDRVWLKLIEFCDSDTDFEKSDIVQVTDASDRTVHDVIQTALDHGVLKRREESRLVEFGDRGRKQQQNVAIYSSAETAPETPEDTETEDTTPTPEADKPDSTSDEVGQTDVSPTDTNITESHADMHEARYVIECPDCHKSMTREQNSSLVKDVRARKRVCGDCETTLELAKDNRPNPPQCPECDREVLFVSEHDESTSYVHDAHITTIGGLKSREIDDSCLVS